MKVTLTNEESEKHFHNALCNGADITSYDLVLDYKDADYAEAKKTLSEKINTGNCPKEMLQIGNDKPTISVEDVWMEILRNGKELCLVDEGCDGEYTRSITLKDVHDRVQKTPIDHLMDAINEEDDAVTADVILQTVFYEEIIFG